MAKALTLRVVKAVSMLGSSQGLSMLCSVIRMKLMSILIGPAGVGLLGALTSANDLFVNVSQLNIRTTAVPQMATASPSDFNAILICVRRYARLLGFVGMAVMFALSPMLSRFTFGSDQYAWAYRIVSISVMFYALAGSESVILQATGRYKAIAAGSLVTSVVGMALAVVLYLGLDIDGIAPSIVAYTVVSWLATMWFTRKIGVRLSPVAPVGRPTWRQSLQLGRGFIVAGALLTLTSLANDGVNFLFMAAVRRIGSEETLGFYQAGMQMVWRYTSVVFSAFAFEFYPRLAGAAKNRRHTSLLITHQSIVTSWMLLPVIAAGVILAPWLVRLLYSADFAAATPYVVWGMAGMMLKPLTLAMSYSFLAAGLNRTYCITELISAVTGFTLNVIGLKYFGFTGLGVAVALWLIADLVVLLAAARIARAAMPGRRAVMQSLLLMCATMLLALLMELL